jgi:hypothetical protein
VVEHHLAKVGVAGSNPVVRSRNRRSGGRLGPDAAAKTMVARFFGETIMRPGNLGLRYEFGRRDPDESVVTVTFAPELPHEP